MKQTIQITESELIKMISESVNKILKEEWTNDNDIEREKKCSEIQRVAKETCEKLGATKFWGESPSGLAFCVELNEGDNAWQKAALFQDVLRKALKTDDCFAKPNTRIGGTAYLEIHLPSPNYCGLF